MKFTDIALLFEVKPSLKVKIYKILPWGELFAIAMLIIATARPQLGRSYEEITTKGIDIMLALDISSSMRTIDFPPEYELGKIRETVALGKKLPPERIMLAKDAAKDFIKGRKNDRIGLVIFSRSAFTQCPLTLDYNILLQLLDKVHIGMIEDGTAVGMGIATALNRFKESDAKSFAESCGKVIILLTDGRNNAGKITPTTATELAKSLGIKIYTIGAGNKGISIYPVETPLGIQYAQVPGEEINEDELNNIAETTGGLYFLAETPDALTSIYKTIDKLEKVEIKSRRYTLYKEIFRYFAIVAFATLTIQAILSFTFIAKIP